MNLSYRSLEFNGLQNTSYNLSRSLLKFTNTSDWITVSCPLVPHKVRWTGMLIWFWHQMTRVRWEHPNKIDRSSFINQAIALFLWFLYEPCIIYPHRKNHYVLSMWDLGEFYGHSILIGVRSSDHQSMSSMFVHICFTDVSHYFLRIAK